MQPESGVVVVGARQTALYFEKKGYEVTWEHQIKGNGAVDLVARKPGECVAIEIETGKSDIRANLEKVRKAGFDRVVLVSTSPAASVACTRAVGEEGKGSPPVEFLRSLDVS